MSSDSQPDRILPPSGISLNLATSQLAASVITKKVRRKLGACPHLGTILVINLGRWTVVLGHEEQSDLPFSGASRCSSEDNWSFETGTQIAAWRAADDLLHSIAEAAKRRGAPMQTVLTGLKDFIPVVDFVNEKEEIHRGGVR